MLKNYFKIAFRNLWKHKSFSAINIIGLSLGLACFLMISMFVADELSYDRYNEKADRIYRINTDIRLGESDNALAVTSDPMGETLKRDYPQVEEYVRFYNSNGSKLIKKDGKYINETKVTHVDSTLFNVFSLPAIIGNTKTALNEPNTVVITESAADRYFGSPDQAINKMIETDDKGSTLYKVTAVIEDIPKNSHFDFDFFFSMKNVDYDFGMYLSYNFQTYILLKPGVDYREFNKKLPEVIDKYVVPQIIQFFHIKSMDDFADSGNKMEISLIPLTDIHLNSSRTGELGANGNVQYIYIFSAVALFILLIACINFMNLSTARSSGRAKEVGIRKVLGSHKKYLIAQFLTESTLMAYMALAAALFFAWSLLPWFNNLSGKELQFANFFKTIYIIPLLLLPLFVGALAGIYPAFFLSSFKPISILKGKISSGSKKDYFRNTLVVFQFTTSIVLIIGTIVIYKQLDYIQNKNVGFDKEQVMLVKNSGLPTQARKSIKNEITGLNTVKSSSFAGYIPVSSSGRSSRSYAIDAAMNGTNSFTMQNWNVDYDYIPTLGMEMIKGRNFSADFGTDSTAIILNEAAVKLAGFKDPIGKKIYTFGSDKTPISYTVIGVVKNFNFESLRQQVGPLSFSLGANDWVSAYRFSTTDVGALINTIEGKYKAASPEMPFKYEFLDEAFDTMYRQEQRVGKVALTFAFLAIVIACLGLFGLATYIAEQRTKEIGIRKVLGASVSSIVSMLSKDFIKLVLIAFIIAIPIAFWTMHEWLQEFAYRINISWWIFLATGGTALLIALLTVSFQAIKAAIANPVKSLRTE
ncbi:MAG TPA: ABC transporter permease [Leeuwenhoekiella sp.]|nr:ABC transporter permease [Leeuwenhoekiella sp.]